MVAGRKIQTTKVVDRIPSSPMPGNVSVSAKNLRKTDLGAVIMGCTHATMAECLTKQLFGLPTFHCPYVRNIEPGLPLFLFNFSDRKLHGIYEAASPGQMNIDPYAWTDNGTERSPYPAQVRIHIRMQCHPLMENQYKKILEDNYYSPIHFWFELDHVQTRGLTALFTPSAVKPTCVPVPPRLPVKYTKPNVASRWTDLFKAVPSTTSMTPSFQECIDTDIWEQDKSIELSNDSNENNSAVHLDDRDTHHSNSCKTSCSALVDMKQKEPVSDWEELVDVNVEVLIPRWDGDNQTMQREEYGNVELDTDGEQMLLKLKMLSANRSKGCMKDSDIPSGPEDVHENATHCSEEPVILAKKKEHLAASDLYHGNSELIQVIKDLNERTANLEKQQVESNQEIKQLRDRVTNSERKVQLIKDYVKELESKNDLSMTNDDSLNKFVEQCLGSEKVIYLMGGFNGSCWLSALESFSPSLDLLTPLKSMSCTRSYASAVALDGTPYIFGGGDGILWSNSVERYDPRYDEWTSCPNMIHERGSLAGATLNNKIFAIGGGDGKKSFSDVEMFDPALGRWINSQSMLQKRFAPAAAELHGVLYAVGGYDGEDYLQSAERFDPREAYWTRVPSMKLRRGCHSLAAFNGKLYAIGGYDGQQMASSVEIFDPRLGYWIMGEPLNFARGYAAAVVLGDTLLSIGGVKDGVNIVETVECYKEESGWAVSGLKAVGQRCFCSAVVL